MVCSYKFYQITEITIETFPSYEIDNLLERCNQALLKKRQLKLKAIDSVLKTLGLTG